MMVFLSVATNSFFSLKNVVNILEANSYRLIVATGMMCIMASGAIDLSAGSILSFSAICLAKALKAELPVALCIVFTLILGAGMGSINGSLIYVTRINAFIITLATSFMYRGLSLIVTQGIPITKLPQAFRDIGCGDFLGMESGVTFAFAVVFLLIPLFYHMRWGHYIMSLGGNPESLQRSGVPIGRYRISAFAYMGMLAALSGIIVTARLNSAEANAGLGMEMDAICAVIMGGTALHGGNGNLLGTVIAVFLLGLIRNGLTIMSVSSYYQQFITGAMLLCAVVIAELRERRGRVG
ncbi:MAG: ABC transporter permease [Candidatus Pelethousia sp.]|nr:ABC transporter permease [Candidatus Pelethousia sp.]